MDSIGLMFYNARWYDPRIISFNQPDTLIPDPGNPLDYNRYGYVRYNPLRYNDPTGHLAWFVTGGIGAVIGGVTGGLLYWGYNKDTFDKGEFWTSVIAGGAVGGLIGSGVGLLAAPTTTTTIATAATAILGTGTGAAGSGTGYIMTNQNSFEENAFIENTVVGGAVGGISAVTPLSPIGVTAKTVTHIAGAETLYALQTDQWNVSEATNAAWAGAIGAGLDVTGSFFFGGSSSFYADKYAQSGPLGYMPPNGQQEILTHIGKTRGLTGLKDFVVGTISGAAASFTTWLTNLSSP